VGSPAIVASATGLSAGNYDFTDLVNATLTINKAHLTVTADNQTRLYGQANPNLTETITGFVNGQDLASSGVTGTATGSTSATATTAVGSPAIVASATGLSAGNYDFTDLVNATLTINKAYATLLVTKPYDGTTSSAIGNLSINGVNGETLTLAGSGPATIASKNVSDNASNYIASLNALSIADGSGSASNYQFPGTSSRSTNNSVTLSKAALTLAPSIDSKVYDGTFNSSAIVSAIGKAVGDTITVSEKFASKDALGSNASILQIKPGYTIRDGSNTDMSSNYTITDTASANGTVIPKTVSISAQKTYNGTTNLSGFVAIDTGIANEILSYGGATSNDPNVTTANKFISAITLANGTGGLASNYQLPTLDYLNAPVTIPKANLTVTADNKSRLYGEANPPLTTTVSGFVNSEDATTALGFSGAGSATTTATSTTNVGQATITASVGTLIAANYDFVPVNGTLTIQPLQSMVFTPPPPPKVDFKPLATPDTDPLPIKGLLGSATVATDTAVVGEPCKRLDRQNNQRCQPTK
jgi:hypothetical protein